MILLYYDPINYSFRPILRRVTPDILGKLPQPLDTWAWWITTTVTILWIYRIIGKLNRFCVVFCAADKPTTLSTVTTLFMVDSADIFLNATIHLSNPQKTLNLTR